MSLESEIQRAYLSGDRRRWWDLLDRAGLRVPDEPDVFPSTLKVLLDGTIFSEEAGRDLGEVCPYIHVRIHGVGIHVEPAAIEARRQVEKFQARGLGQGDEEICGEPSPTPQEAVESYALKAWGGKPAVVAPDSIVTSSVYATVIYQAPMPLSFIKIDLHIPDEATTTALHATVAAPLP